MGSECRALCGLRRPLQTIAMSIQGTDPAHGWPHTQRVLDTARRLVELENLAVDMCILETAIILHDVGRGLPGDENHAVKSARFARTLLEAMAMPAECVERVVHAILSHSYSLGVEPETLEAIVLSDADKLDALGAVGIARVFHTGCQLGRSFEDSITHIRSKLLRLPDLVRLPTAKREANLRLRIIEEFLREWE